MQRCLEKSTIASSENIPMDKNPQDRISVRLLRRIIQAFSNIISETCCILEEGYA